MLGTKTAEEVVPALPETEVVPCSPESSDEPSSDFAELAPVVALVGGIELVVVGFPERKAALLFAFATAAGETLLARVDLAEFSSCCNFAASFES